MKKIIILIFTLFMVMTKVNANSKFYSAGKVEPNFYVERKNGDNRQNGLIYNLFRDDGEHIYCIDPFEPRIRNEYYDEYNYNNSFFNLSDEELNKLNMIGYFGYGYKDHTSIEWYGVTQYLIWNNLGYDYVYLTDSFGNKINMYESEINEIYGLIDEYNKLPSFANNEIYYTKNNTYELTDLNNVLVNYDILSSDLDVKKDNNKLIINTKDDGIYNINFIKRSPIERQYKLYKLNDSQSFLYPGKFNDITFNLKIKVITGEVNLTKIGINSSPDSSLSGAIYGVYQNNLQVGSIVTDDNGIGHIDNLAAGKYMIKEIVPSKGYMLDVNKFNIEISDNTRNIYIESYERLKSNRLIINKYYGEEGNYLKEDNAVFEIYDSNHNLYKIVETKNGVIDINLPYGDYLIIQIKGIEGYKMSEPFYIESESLYNSYTLYDELIKGDLVLNKYNVDLETCNKEENASFEIYKDDILYGVVETKDGVIDIDLPYGKYLIKQVSGIEGYKYVEDFEVFIEEEKEYKYDLYDEAIYGNLIINKYYGESIKEDGAKFEIYDSNHNLYKTVETKDGVIDIDLPYGKYLIKQVSGIEGYKYVEDFEVFIEEEKEYKFDLYDEAIYGNLIINKYYGDSIKEDGAKFEVYNDINNYVGITNDGKLSMILPYGEYNVKQLKGIDGYSYVDDFNINIDSEGDYDYDLYDEIIVKVPNTGIYSKTNYIFILYIFIGLTLIIFSTKKTTQ